MPTFLSNKNLNYIIYCSYQAMENASAITMKMFN